MPRGVYPHGSQSSETIARRASACMGKRRTLAIRLKMGEAQKRCGNRPPSRKGEHWGDESRRNWGEKQRNGAAPMLGKHHTVHTRLNLSIMRRGPNGSNWQGGICESTELLRHTVEYKIWREEVFRRDNYTCKECGRRGGRLHPHHIRSFARFPELRFEVSNGITFCEDCHKKTDNFGGRALKEGRLIDASADVPGSH